jgi:hypothetical protein
MINQTIILLISLCLGVKCLFSQIISVGSEASWISISSPSNYAKWGGYKYYLTYSFILFALAIASSVSKVTNTEQGV